MGLTQNAAGRRIASLLDANSFVEVGGLVTARSTDFNLSAAQTPSDGVITGYGTIDGNLVYVYSQDASVLGGSVGEMHAKKITRIYSLARKTGAPIIGLIDCAGIRLEESTDALNALGRILRSQVMASGLIPQLVGIFGKLMNASHVSLRDDYEVSCPEIDFIVDEAWKNPGVVGCRITGGGFGGCAVSIVKDEAVEELKETIGKAYKEKVGLDAEFYVIDAGEGAHRVE